MILATMRFAGYEWLHNPVSLVITNGLSQNRHSLYEENVQVSAQRLDLKVYSGKGELAGGDCIEQYKKLEKLFLSGKKGVLTIPGMEPVYASFSKLEAVGTDTPDLLSYTFEFVQELSAEKSTYPCECECKAFQTLYDIAYEWDIPLERLVELNPQIRRPDELKEGERVRLC